MALAETTDTARSAVRRTPAAARDRAVVLTAFGLMPATFYQGALGGFRATGLAWFVLLAVGGWALAFRTISPRSLRYATPYLVFLAAGLVSLAWAPDFVKGMQTLAQYATLVIVYLVAWRAAGDDPQLLLRLRSMASWLLPTAMVLFGQAILTSGGFDTQGARPAAMSIALLFVLATHGRSRRVTLLIGAAVLGYNLVAGSRMGAAVMALLILLVPAARFTRRQQLAVAGVGFAVFLALIPTAAFQDRWFVGNDPGTFSDIVTLEPNFNTAGRSDNWPAILEVCSERPLQGHGIGAAGPITNEINEKANHPHNEFLRSYCDSGIVAGSAFWLFFAMVGVRAISQSDLSRAERRRSPAPIAALAILTLLLFSATDNITIYTIQYMAPATVLFAISDRAFAARRVERWTPRPVT